MSLHQKQQCDSLLNTTKLNHQIYQHSLGRAAPVKLKFEDDQEAECVEFRRRDGFLFVKLLGVTALKRVLDSYEVLT